MNHATSNEGVNMLKRISLVRSLCLFCAATFLTLALDLGCSESGSLPIDFQQKSHSIRVSALGCLASQRSLAASAQAPLAFDLGRFTRLHEFIDRFLREDKKTQLTLVAQGEKLARERKEWMRALILSEPEMALKMAIHPTLKAALPKAIGQHIETFVEGPGDLRVIAVDGEEGSFCSQRLVSFFGSDAVFEASVYGNRLHEPSQFNVYLQGLWLDGVIAVVDTPYVQPHESFGQATTGPKTAVYIRVDFADDPGDPLSQTDAEKVFSQVVSYFENFSYNQTTLSAVFPPTFRMPRSKAEYATTVGGDNILRDDAQAAAASAGFDWNNYDINMVVFRQVSEWLPASGWAEVGGRNVSINGNFSPYVASHEIGHTYGLGHANYWDPQKDSIFGAGSMKEYGNSYDVMGSGQLLTSHFNGSHKAFLNWIPDHQVLQPITSGNYQIFALEKPIDSGVHVINLSRAPLADYWIEFRSALANPIEVLFNLGSSETLLLDMTPGKPNIPGRGLRMGKTFNDPIWNYHITLVGRSDASPESINLRINLGDFPENRSPIVTLQASTTHVDTIGIPINLTAIASDPDGDELAYYWEFTDQTWQASQTKFSTDNQSNQIFIPQYARSYPVRVVVSDMKGKEASAGLILTVGQNSTFVLEGQVTVDGQPWPNVQISDGTHTAYSMDDGHYALPNIPAGEVSLSANKFDYAFSPSFDNPLIVTGNQTELNFSGTPSDSYNLSGRVMCGYSSPTGVKITNQLSTITLDASGLFTFSELKNDLYQLTASSPAWQFDSQYVLVYGGDVSNITFSAYGVSLSGSISGTNGPASVTDGIRIGSASLSDGVLSYSINLVADGYWNLRATAPGYTVLPANFQNPVHVHGANLAELNFVATAGTSYYVIGTVSYDSEPLVGALVISESRISSTDNAGKYLFAGLAGGSYTLTATYPGCSFIPESLTVNVNGNLTGQDFNCQNSAPTVAIAAAVTMNSPTSAYLTVVGADNGGEENLSYTWVCVGTAPTEFSINGSNNAKTTLATFRKAEIYSCEVNIEDPLGLSAKSQVSVPVVAQLSALSVVPDSVQVLVNHTQSFAVDAKDQFGETIIGGMPDWNVSGGGSISNGGLFAAGSIPGGPYTVTATLEDLEAKASVMVVDSIDPKAPSVTFVSPVAGKQPSPLRVIIAASDEKAVTRVWLEVDEQKVLEWSAPPYDDTLDLNPGKYILIAFAEDAAGNIGQSDAIEVEIEAGQGSLEGCGCGHSGKLGGSYDLLLIAMGLCFVLRKCK